MITQTLRKRPEKQKQELLLKGGEIGLSKRLFSTRQV
jgi:hypothetical protein